MLNAFFVFYRNVEKKKKINKSVLKEEYYRYVNRVETHGNFSLRKVGMALV